MKILTIVKDDHITGIEYGTVEVPDSNESILNARIKNNASRKYENAWLSYFSALINKRQKHK